MVLTIGIAPPAQANHDVFISEYMEGSSFNKSLEIFNPMGVVVDLTGYEVEIYYNGSVAPGATIALTGNALAAGDVWVLSDDGANAAILAVTDQTTTSSLWNGDDAIVDVFGKIGEDPGNGWTGGGCSTQNQTLRRKATICEGDTDGSNDFDPSVEWDCFVQDDSSDLGSHSSGCGPTPNVSESWGMVKSIYR